MKAVIAAGADAVYIGGPRFGARAYADNPEEEELIRAIDYAHLHGVRVHMTVNTLFKESECALLVPFLTPYYEAGVDAVLVQDIGVMKMIRSNFPDLPVHVSTQMSVSGPESAAHLARLGASRIVLARELSVEEIRIVCESTDAEIEVFAHGALCVCYSGRCLMSSMLGGRSGNRGRCAQPCRLPYTLYSGHQKTDQGDLLSPRDLSAAPLLQDLITAGVRSLKIEGRMKSPAYASGVTHIYRNVLDRYAESGICTLNKKERETLLGLFQRDGFTDGYLTGNTGDMIAKVNRKKAEGGIVKGIAEEMERRFVAEQPPVSAAGSAVVKTGVNVCMDVSAGKYTGHAEGPAPEAAKGAPLAEERITKQLTKSGDTPFAFTDFKTVTDGKSFLPVSALNALRRDALSDLAENMLKPFRRKIAETMPALTESENEGAASQGTADAEPPLIEVSVDSEEQLTAALADPAVSVVIGSMGLFAEKTGTTSAVSEKAAGAFAARCTAAGKEPWAALPLMLRTGARCRRSAAPVTREILARLHTSGIAGFLAADYEGLAMLNAAGLSGSTCADASLYTMNRTARSEMERYAARGTTIPHELTLREMKARGVCESALIVYGRTYLMVTAQCPMRNAGKCRGERGYETLADRKRAYFPVKRECAFCYNVICNSVPTVLLSETDAAIQAGIRRFRLVFTDETGDETAKILGAYGARIMEKNGTDPVEQDIFKEGTYTRGHFVRGVE